MCATVQRTVKSKGDLKLKSRYAVLNDANHFSKKHSKCKVKEHEINTRPQLTEPSTTSIGERYIVQISTEHTVERRAYRIVLETVS